MAQWILMNNVRAGTSTMRAGSVVDDAVENLAAIRASGGVLLPASDATLAAAAAALRDVGRNAGLPIEGNPEFAMLAAMMPFVQTLGPLALVAGTLTVNTGITVTARTRVIPVLAVPGAGVSGTRYAITGLVVGSPGTGAFTCTAKDSAAGNNTVATDVSTLYFILIG
jgi:hypothetical protein